MADFNELCDLISIYKESYSYNDYYTESQYSNAKSIIQPFKTEIKEINKNFNIAKSSRNKKLGMQCISKMQNLISRLQHTTNSLTPEDIKKFGIGLIVGFGALGTAISAFISHNAISGSLNSLDGKEKDLRDRIAELEKSANIYDMEANNAKYEMDKAMKDCKSAENDYNNTKEDNYADELEKRNKLEKHLSDMKMSASKYKEARDLHDDYFNRYLNASKELNNTKKHLDVFKGTKDRMKAAYRIGYDKNSKYTKEELAPHKKEYRKAYAINAGTMTGLGAGVGAVTTLALNKFNVKYKLCIKKMNKFLEECNKTLQSMKQEVASW